MSFHVHVSDRAEGEADSVYQWIADRSPDGADRWWQAFREALHAVGRNPKAHALAPESDAFEEPLHNVLFKTRRGRVYRALFVIRGNDVYVLSVRSGAQNLLGPADIDLP